MRVEERLLRRVRGVRGHLGAVRRTGSPYTLNLYLTTYTLNPKPNTQPLDLKL